MEIFHSENGEVVKIIHNDLSETAIKTTKSCTNTILDGAIDIGSTDRNKYSIFISSSRGCKFKCKFCYLTLKNAKYSFLNEEQIFKNIIESLEYINSQNHIIKDKYVKLSFMGMGDALGLGFVKNLSIKLINYILLNNLAKGIDGIDLSTVYPKIKNDWVTEFYELEDYLKTVKNNPDIPSNRSLFRLFYSLISGNPRTRDQLIPGTTEVNSAIQELLKFSKNNKHNLIFHYVLLNDINDSEQELSDLINLVKDYKLDRFEIRFLRFNSCDNSSFKESLKLDYFIKELLKITKNIKLQVSSGDEVKAACGQFIIKNFIRA